MSEVSIDARTVLQSVSEVLDEEGGEVLGVVVLVLRRNESRYTSWTSEPLTLGNTVPVLADYLLSEVNEMLERDPAQGAGVMELAERFRQSLSPEAREALQRALTNSKVLS